METSELFQQVRNSATSRKIEKVPNDNIFGDCCDSFISSIQSFDNETHKSKNIVQDLLLTV
jgi:hypothetical protein